MEQPDDQQNYTCPCQNCGGHIKFDSTLLRKGETRTVECPHCHLDTVLFLRDKDDDPLPTKHKTFTYEKLNLSKHKGAITRFELFVLQLTRILTLVGAALLVTALALIALVFVWTLIPKSSSKIRTVHYEQITTALQSQSEESQPQMSYGNLINSDESVPASVATFLVQHPDFKSDTTWMSSNQRKAFLNNFSEIIQQAKRNGVDDEKLVQIVTSFLNIWTTENSPASKTESLDLKKEIRAFCIGVVPILFIAMAVLCLVLVLLGIERNVRVIAENSSSSQITKKTTES
jgi:hypothetical protein